MGDAASALLDPGNLVVNMVGALFAQILYLALIAWIVPPRSKKLYWGLEMGITVLVLFFKPLLTVEVRIPLNICMNLVIPVALLGGPVFTRVVVAVLATLAQLVAELVAVVPWMLTSGLGVVENSVLIEHLPVYLCGMILGHGLTMCVLMAGVRVLVRRFLPSGEASDAGWSKAGGSWALKYASFLVVQWLLLVAFMSLVFDVQRWEGVSALLFAVLCGACLGADVLLFLYVGRSVAQTQEEVRAAFLEERVAEYLRRSEGMQTMLAETAHLRHDLRNHRMVVEALCGRGDYERAEAYLDEFAKRLVRE